MDAEHQLRERCRAIVEEAEGTTLVEPSCLSDATATPASVETLFRGSSCDAPTRAIASPSPPSKRPSAWLLLFAGAVVGLVLAVAWFLVCRKPAARKRGGGRRERKRQVARDEYSDDEEDGEEDDEEDGECELPEIVDATPPPSTRRPAAKRAARATAEAREDEDPMFQPL